MKVHISMHEVYPEYRIEPVEPGWRTYTVADVDAAFLDRYNAARDEWIAMQIKLRQLEKVAILAKSYKEALGTNHGC